MIEVKFIEKLVEKAEGQLAIRRRIAKIKKLKMQEKKQDNKEVMSSQQEISKIEALDDDEEEEEKEDASSEDDEEFMMEDMDQDLEKPYPEECRVLDIMRDKYLEAVRFFTDTNDKK